MKVLLCGPVDITNPDYGWELLTSFHTNGMHCDWVDIEYNNAEDPNDPLNQIKSIAVIQPKDVFDCTDSSSPVKVTFPYDNRGTDIPTTLTFWCFDTHPHNMHGPISKIFDVDLNSFFTIGFGLMYQTTNQYFTCNITDSDYTYLAIVPHGEKVGFLLVRSDDNSEHDYGLDALDTTIVFRDFINMQNGINKSFDVYKSAKTNVITVVGPTSNLTLTNISADMPASCYENQNVTLADGRQMHIQSINVNSWTNFDLNLYNDSDSNDWVKECNITNSYFVITRLDTNFSCILNVDDQTFKSSVPFLTAEDVGKTIQCTIQHIDPTFYKPANLEDYYVTI